jgi:hypothetical protein
LTRDCDPSLMTAGGAATHRVEVSGALPAGDRLAVVPTQPLHLLREQMTASPVAEGVRSEIISSHSGTDESEAACVSCALSKTFLPNEEALRQTPPLDWLVWPVVVGIAVFAYRSARSTV